MTLPVTFSYTGVKYTDWVKMKMGASLKCTKAESLGSKQMADGRELAWGGRGPQLQDPHTLAF